MGASVFLSSIALPFSRRRSPTTIPSGFSRNPGRVAVLRLSPGSSSAPTAGSGAGNKAKLPISLPGIPGYARNRGNNKIRLLLERRGVTSRQRASGAVQAGSPQEPMDLRDDRGALADRRRDALGRSGAHIADGEDAGRLVSSGRPAAARGVGAAVPSRRSPCRRRRRSRPASRYWDRRR